MEVIDELETEARSVYAGYLGFNGNLDLAIAIRTGVVKDKTLYVFHAPGARLFARSAPGRVIGLR